MPYVHDPAPEERRMMQHNQDMSDLRTRVFSEGDPHQAAQFIAEMHPGTEEFHEDNFAKRAVHAVVNKFRRPPQLH